MEWYHTQVEVLPNKCIHNLFVEQVERTPNAIAVVFEEQKLTYQELNQRANQLAYYLQNLGVKPEVLVGICVERSLEMIVGLWGILKAGGAYLPLDPSYPQQRLSFMLSDSQVSIILTQEELRQNLPEYGAKFVCLDTEWNTICRNSQQNFVSAVNPENLVYLIYTSGSTGEPKGVQVTHKNLVHSTSARLSYYQNYQKINNCFLLISSFAFDSSVAGIFWTLCCGGKLVLPPSGWEREVKKIIDLITYHQVSHFLCLPSLYMLILSQSRSRQLLSLQVVIVAGEPCSVNLVKQHWLQLPKSLLFNEYGPTEATVWSTVYHCQSPDITKVPIGSAIANTEVYILDAALQPVPIGVTGEIYIGGYGVARGYLHRPDLTQEKFILHPVKNSPQNSDRLYKTGDLARYLPDGNIEYIGRIDNQVKIRGFRIELEEIAAVLSQHPAILEAVVIIKDEEHESDNATKNPRLVAYFVSEQPQITINELRSFLNTKLPDYMIPSVFVMLASMPLTPNGKLDRKNLPAPSKERPQLEQIYIAPQSHLEKLIAGIWTKLLRIDLVGIDDNFFDLGGNSLSILQVAKLIEEKLSLNLAPVNLFQYPTISGLTKYLTTNFLHHPQNNQAYKNDLQNRAQRQRNARARP